MEDWAEIRRLHRADGMAIKAIARRLNVSRNTVRSAIGSDGPPRYVRQWAGSAVDGFEPRIRLGTALSDDEVSYLALHVARVTTEDPLPT